MIQIQHHEPAIFEQVSFLVKILPYAERSPAYPYTNIAVNISVSTKAHRDSSDLSWCTAFTIQKCIGGQLCLHESGLVFDSNHGDFILFRSERETHFNLPFQGLRASIVLHTDKRGRDWEDNYNRWASHVN